MKKFTKKDSLELGIPLELVKKWQFVMDTLWAFLLSYAKVEEKVSVTNNDNYILYHLGNGHRFKIKVDFYNEKYLCLTITIESNNDFEASVTHIDAFEKEGIIKILAHILSYAEKVKL